MSYITIPGDFLESDLRPGQLYELVISVGVEISETAFRSIISELNVQFISPRIIFSGSLQGKKLMKIFYSAGGYGIGQRQIVSSLREAFAAYSPEVVFEKSEGEIPGAIPLVAPKTEAPILSLDWLKQGYQEIVESVSEKTGLPTWSILPLAGSGVLLLVIALKAKPILIIKK